MLKSIYRKILNSIQLNDFIYRRIKDKNSYTLEYSIKLLNKFRPNPNSSCYVKRDNDWLKSKEYDLDIIVPAYNVSKFIRKCILSILNQNTKYKYRIIIINDGSTDNTSKILDEFKKYPIV